jgi:Peptidase A4 family
MAGQRSAPFRLTRGLIRNAALALALCVSLAAPTQVVEADDPASAAIRQVIQRSNDEQVQAIASKDPSVMADTVTTDHYLALVQINQALLDSGVASIRLVKLEWGDIRVSGSTATATTFETWRTTLADGTTEQSRDLNGYRLVADASGAWKIAADDHPGIASSPPPGVEPIPGVPDKQDTSHNWAGYAATGGAYTAVSGTWTVPQPTADSSFGVDATWVGIGGVESRDLIQAGTQQTVNGSGRTQYQAWLELLPRASRSVPLPVHAGDSVTVALSEQAAGSWQIAFTNNTTGRAYSTTVPYTSSHSSAEWVEEAPSAGRGLLPLDDFGSIQFSNGSTVKDGQTLSVGAANAQPITMVSGALQPLVVPSPLGADGSSFSVARTDAPATIAVPSRRGLPGLTIP